MKQLLTLGILLILSCNKADWPVYIKGNTFQTTQAVTTPAADAYVRNGTYAAKNYGTTSNMAVKGTKATNYARSAFLRFNIPLATGTAVLRLYGRNAEGTAPVTITAYGTSDDWSETGITWNNQPATGGAINSVGISSSGWYEIDVTDYIKSQSDGVASFVLKNPTNQDDMVDLSSREGANPPQLLIEATVTEPTDTTTTDTTGKADTTIVQTTRPDHIFVIFEENKGYSQIVGSSSAPYINSLISKGTLFTASHGITHPSYPNYIAWFSGSTQGVTSDACISGAPKSAQNLYTALKSVGRTFSWYSEGLPSVGSETCSSGYYREKHNPVTIFSNVPKTANQPLTAINLSDTSTFKNLPNVVAISPDMRSDMHDASVSYGDNWLKTKLGKLIDWCSRNNAVFILTCDEDNKYEGNRIPTIAVGGNVKAGYKSGENINHYSFLRWICEQNGAGTDFHSNVKNANPINNFYK